MIELAPDLITALQAEADRQGKTVSEVVSEVIKEWIDPKPWFDINEPMEPMRRVTLPIEGATYRSGDGVFPIQVKALEPAYEPVSPPTIITITYPKEWEGEQLEEVRITGEDWMELMEQFWLTLETASNPGFTGVPKGCTTAESSPEQQQPEKQG